MVAMKSIDFVKLKKDLLNIVGPSGIWPLISAVDTASESRLIEYAKESDYEYIVKNDRHILESLIITKIMGKEIYILRTQQNTNIGWMRYGYFWDNTPFMNMIWLDEQYRGKGIGKQAALFWEKQMKQMGSKLVMTSSLANETSTAFL